MNTRRHFFQQLASGLIAATAPGLFLPKLIKPQWKAAPEPVPIGVDPAYGIDSMAYGARQFYGTWRWTWIFDDNLYTFKKRIRTDELFQCPLSVGWAEISPDGSYNGG